ncbi:Uncharacterized protein Adt_03836 [Abeliophyllum distichum]|uniref:Uncharacterized protein n=1 Tax=Abeliophyllum distichum TaxID=126358 RepID=A0ABD1W1N9_9LAMI
MGVVGQLLPWRQSTACPEVVDYYLGAVDCLLGSSRSTAPFGVVDDNFLADCHTCGNVEIDRSPAGNIVELEIPKACSLYSSQKKLNRMLGKIFLYDDYVHRAPLPSEQLPGSDLREIAIYKDSMDGGLRRDMEAMRSCVISHMSKGISRRNIEDIEKVLAVYNRKVLTLEDSLVKACKRTVTNLEVIENEKSEEIHHLKKKNSSLRKSYEASEALVKEQEEEIDNLRSALAQRSA